jgi:hypothetical protein
MKKLIKIDYYYVIDDTAEIKEGDYWTSLLQSSNLSKSIHICKNIAFNNPTFLNDKDCDTEVKVICSTNPNLPLPQITNASDDMVDKEVEVEFKTIEVPISSYGISYAMGKGEPNTEEKEVAILKPISKETYSYDEGDRINAEFARYETLKFKETSTNETLEEVAFKELYHKLSGWTHQPTFSSEELQEAWIAGYKHCEKTMYSHKDIAHAISYAIHECKLGNNYVTILTNWLALNVNINNNKK